MADVTISGQINNALTNDKYVGNAVSGTTDVSGSVQGMHAITGDSFLTFSGSEDLGNGLKANFKLEQALNLSGYNGGTSTGNTPRATGIFSANSSGNSNREAWIGISSDIGSLNIGNQYSPMFLAAIAADPMGANNITGAMGNFGLSAVVHGNSIGYTSPSFNGITLSAMEYYGTVDTSASTNNAGNGYGWSLNYANGPLALAYGRDEGTNSGTGTAKTSLADISQGGLLGTNATNNSAVTTAAIVKDGDTITGQSVSASYDLVVAKVGYWGSRIDYTAGDKAQGQALAISAPFGNILVAYTAGTGSATPNGGTTTNFTGYQYSAQYNFTKRTNLYLAGGQTKDTTNSVSRETYGFGLHHSF